jgi:hypothetical protein
MNLNLNQENMPAAIFSNVGTCDAIFPWVVKH